MAQTQNTAPKGRRVIALYADFDTQQALREWAEAQGFDLGWSFDGWPQESRSFDFHVTLVASENAIALEPSGRWVDTVELTPNGFKVMGDNTPALAIEPNDTLNAMREFFVKSFGIKPTYPDFSPHVSLSYKWNGSPSIDGLPPPPIALRFDYLVVAELSDDPISTGDSERYAAKMTDTAVVAGTRLTSSGYLVADCRVARTGIQEYHGSEVGMPDRQLVKVYRPPEEVFQRDSLASFAFRPVTIDHPDEDVSPETWKRDAVGSVGNDIVREGGFVRVPLILMDKRAIEAVASGKREISMGYTCRLDFASGVSPDGQSYDAIQRDIRINHCAIVDAGRAGPQCKIGDRVTSPSPRQTQETKVMAKSVIIDGRPTEVSDGVAAYITSLEGRAAAADQKLGGVLDDLKKLVPDVTSQLATLRADNEAKDKALADAKKQAEEAQSKVLSDADLAKIVATRADLNDKGRKIAGVEIGDKSPNDYRRAVVAKKLGDAAVKDRSDEYVLAQFDMLAASEGTGADGVRDVFAGGVQAAASSSDKARDNYLKGLDAAWKGAAAK